MPQEITLLNLQLPELAAASGTSGRSNARGDVWECPEVKFRRGEHILIHARSGTGKSSLCDFLFGARTDYRGRILFDSIDTLTITMDQWCHLRRSSLAYLPQEAPLFPHMTVMENIMIKNRLTHHRSEQWIREALRRLDVEHRAEWPVERLSVGQRQRVAAISALCQPADFILLDEPVSHLDPSRAEALASLIADSASAEGAGIIATSVGAEIPLTFTRRLLL